ncbi:hypothetical protein ACFSLT_19660 [Novosphingobium resinovorum]
MAEHPCQFAFAMALDGAGNLGMRQRSTVSAVPGLHAVGRLGQQPAFGGGDLVAFIHDLAAGGSTASSPW